MVIAVPLHLGKLGGRCISIEVLKMDSWRVKNVFKSSSTVFYEAISSCMYKLSDHLKITKRISLERYSSTKKFLLCVEDPKREEIFHISKFIVGDPREPYCKIPIKSLKLLNKFLEQLLIIQRLSFVKMMIISCFRLISSIIIPILNCQQRSLWGLCSAEA